MALMEILQSNLQAITAIAGVLLSLLGTLGITRAPATRGRHRLKLDLEIYTLMEESKETWTDQIAVKREIDALSKKIFLEDDGFRHGYHTTIGIVLALGFGLWTYDLLRNDLTDEFEPSWWALVTVYWCLVGALIVLASLVPSLRHKLWFVETPLGAPKPDTEKQAGPAPQ